MPAVLLRRETRVVHGHRRAYVLAGPRLGTAPVLWLIHGLGDSSRTWEEVVPLLAQRYTVVAPDLLGHGASDKPRADYSVGGFANGMRDLMVVLGVERATVVGHSLGGGVALQFAYQYPERVERLVLVASGGLGAEVHPLLRAAALPGASTAIAVSARRPLRTSLLGVSRMVANLGLFDRSDVEEVGRVWEGLQDRATRAAFLRTLRAVVDVRGQSVTSRDRLYLTAATPTLLVWGSRDPVLPVSHARLAADALPGARLEVVARAGHLPHRSCPDGFAGIVLGFLASTTPAAHDPSVWRHLLTGADEDAAALTALPAG
ncbi:MAG: alpha/beta hydrolase fold protein [Frankiales bacterium]|nr:alpha/beta hydrolase fold protein [Frankiales bacterium]